MSAVVLKWRVPVNGQPRLIGGGPVEIELSGQPRLIGGGPVALVAYQGQGDWVHVWTVEPRVSVTPTRQAQAFGTRHLVPDGWVHLGSTLAGMLVSHVFAEPLDGAR